MNTEQLELICEKLGTTIDNLTPAAIEYGRCDAVVGLVVSSLILSTGLILCMVMLYGRIKKGHDVMIDEPVLVVLFAFIFTLIGVVMFAVTVSNYIMWIKFPTMQAYRMVLGWLGK